MTPEMAQRQQQPTSSASTHSLQTIFGARPEGRPIVLVTLLFRRSESLQADMPLPEYPRYSALPGFARPQNTLAPTDETKCGQ